MAQSISIGSFEGDRTPIIRETALASSYSGPAGYAEFEFSGIPGLKSTIAKGIERSEAFGKVLHYEVWQDTAPSMDRYRIKAWLVGEYATGSGEVVKGDVLKGITGSQGVGFLPLAIPFLLLAKIIVLVGIAALIGIILWKVLRTSWGQAAASILGSPFAWGIMVAVVGLMLWNRKGRRRRGS